MRDKTVSKKENLFMASRFVLPEHRELYVRMKAEKIRYIPPELDEEQQAEVSEIIWRAFHMGDSVAVSYYDGRTEQRRIGRVAHVDSADRRIKLNGASEIIWIPFAQMLRAQLVATP